jgi:hypothetical protein
MQINDNPRVPDTPSPKQPINEYGQPVDLKGHVLRESEIVRDKLILLDRAMVSAEGDDSPMQYCVPLKDLVEFVMTEKNNDFYRGERSGRLQGHKEAGAMFLSAFEAELGKFPNTDSWDDCIEAAQKAVATVTQAIIDSAKEVPSHE